MTHLWGCVFVWVRVVTAEPATITDVVSVWVIVVAIIVAVAVLIAIVLLYRAKRAVEYKYSSLLTSQPVEMAEAGDDRMTGLPDDDEDHTSGQL